MPVAFAIHDLNADGSLTRIGNNLVDGISNGAIWALVALGYTMVYGIVELINFAHGEVFIAGTRPGSAKARSLAGSALQANRCRRFATETVANLRHHYSVRVGKSLMTSPMMPRALSSWSFSWVAMRLVRSRAPLGGTAGWIATLQ